MESICVYVGGVARKIDILSQECLPLMEVLCS